MSESSAKDFLLGSLVSLTLWLFLESLPLNFAWMTGDMSERKQVGLLT